MAYEAEISTANPTAILFLLDQSGSMRDGVSGGSEPKSAVLAARVNEVLNNLIHRCSAGDKIKDRFYVGVVGYGGTAAGSAFVQALAGRELVPISELAANYAELRQDPSTELQSAVYVYPTHEGGTPMCQALELAHGMLRPFIDARRDCYPPVVINVTDGAATDGDPIMNAERLRSLKSSDGEVLLMNCHISETQASPIAFPDSEQNLPDEFARKLFQMSSVLPEKMCNMARAEYEHVSDRSRGYVFNADAVALTRFLDIGTRASAAQ